MPLVAENSSLPFTEILRVRKVISELHQEKNQLETRLSELNMTLGAKWALFSNLFGKLSADERKELELRISQTPEGQLAAKNECG